MKTLGTTKIVNQQIPVQTATGRVHCPMCTHNVEATIEYRGKHAKTSPGQKCPRCSGSLDAGFVLRYDQAA